MNTKYDFKDAFKILKAVEKLAKKIYDSKSEIIVRQLENATDKDFGRSIYGLFSLRTNPAKTAKVYTAKEQKQVDKLQAQINELQAQIDKLGTTQVISESYHSLVYDKSTEADKEAELLLHSLIEAIGNASMKNAASKIAKQ